MAKANQNVKAILALQKKIQTSMDKISTERNKLREYVSDINTIIDNGEGAVEELREAKRSMERAGDILSENL
jgi:predicted  nucleic acid-binding Zn-ribbon protein